MKKLTLLAFGAALVIGSPGLSMAGGSTANPNRTTAPGQIQKYEGTAANKSAPGQLKQNPPQGTVVTGPGASQFAPGQVRKQDDALKTGTTSRSKN